MRAKNIVGAMCRQQRMKASIFEKHQTIIMESIRMIVHVVTIKQESSITCFAYILIPYRFILWSISFDFEHFTSYC